MPVREVLQLGNPILRQKALPVLTFDQTRLAPLVEDLKDTLRHWREATTYGRGIAAPQIGVLERVIFLNIDRPWPFFNPVITGHSRETMVVWDACLSFLCIFLQVRRYRSITVEYQDITGQKHSIECEGDLSELLQHEIDHLDGILALDRMTDIHTLCTREEFERRYRGQTVYASSR